MIGKCIRFHEFGSPKDVLRIESKNIETLKEYEVLVRMQIRPINPSDLIPISGAYSHRISLPNIPGYEGVGIVIAVGPSVSQDLLGKRVLPLRGEGTWQEFVKTSVDYTICIPDAIDDFTAAQMYINPVTAWVVCTEVLKLKPRDVLLVNACGSAIGQIFAQLSTILGFKLIAVTRNNKYTKDLLHYGASHVINTSKESLHKTVMELTNGMGADAALDSIGGSDGEELAFSLHPHGNFLTIGLLSGIQIEWSRVINQAKVNANMFHLRHWNEKVSTEKWQTTFNHLITLITKKQLILMSVDSKHDLLNIKDAISALDSNENIKGKVFLTS